MQNLLSSETVFFSTESCFQETVQEVEIALCRLQLGKIEFIEEGSCMPVKGTCVESGRLVVVIDKIVSCLNREQNNLLTLSVGSWVLKERSPSVTCY